MPEVMHILATGARTPLGLSSAPAAAALRAGINRLGEHPYMIDRLGNPMVAAVDGALDPKMAHDERLYALAESAIAELFEGLPAPFASLRTGLFLALPETRPGFTADNATQIGQRITHGDVWPTALARTELFPFGHAAGVLALAAASAALSRGELDLCVVGGVECFFHPDTMEWLDENRQLAGEDGRSSFVPGEGAGFVLLARPRTQSRLRATDLGKITAIATATEQALIKTPDLCLGEGLTSAVRDACEQLPAGRRINDIICDINGERYRAEEWGFVCLRLAHHFDDPTAYTPPAASWGDMGAASIPLFATLACQAAKRGYASGPRAMLWASSEGGRRGAVIMECGA